MMLSRGESARLAQAGGGRSAGRRARRGSLLAEVAMSGVMLMIAMALTVKVLGWVGVERRSWDRRQWAAQEISNLMEEATSRPFEDVTTASLKGLAISPQARALLSAAELATEVAENDTAGGPGSKRVAIRLRWHNRSGEWDAPVRLTSWIYRGRPER
jgi:hypothetical protein